MYFWLSSYYLTAISIKMQILSLKTKDLTVLPLRGSGSVVIASLGGSVVSKILHVKMKADKNEL